MTAFYTLISPNYWRNSTAGPFVLRFELLMGVKVSFSAYIHRKVVCRRRDCSYPPLTFRPLKCKQSGLPRTPSPSRFAFSAVENVKFVFHLRAQRFSPSYRQTSRSRSSFCCLLLRRSTNCRVLPFSRPTKETGVARPPSAAQLEEPRPRLHPNFWNPPTLTASKFINAFLFEKIAFVLLGGV